MILYRSCTVIFVGNKIQYKIISWVRELKKGRRINQQILSWEFFECSFPAGTSLVCISYYLLPYMCISCTLFQSSTSATQQSEISWHWGWARTATKPSSPNLVICRLFSSFPSVPSLPFSPHRWGQSLITHRLVANYQLDLFKLLILRQSPIYFYPVWHQGVWKTRLCSRNWWRGKNFSLSQMLLLYRWWWCWLGCSARYFWWWAGWRSCRARKWRACQWDRWSCPSLMLQVRTGYPN